MVSLVVFHAKPADSFSSADFCNLCQWGLSSGAGRKQEGATQTGAGNEFCHLHLMLGKKIV